ncbi:SRPBCC family protein [Mucilaginibacter xinganensis]|uniref:ATPase n=1 Tax=Mucilaginibacter xinganensis TaxID=1234841 RepID=A0A223NZR5_9SPHI|nr:SRPBCC family protein [Mucilaginibacter xinganensis]ASU35379.1 ATPase [Mucilaginibacter xinganensis]
MNTLTLKTTIKFKAPIAEVWKGLTDPAMVEQYFFGTRLHSDWKVGGPITFSGEWEGNKYEDGGIILDIDAPKFLKYTYWSSMSGTENKPENYNNITYELDETADETTLVITQDGVKNQEAADHSEQNWQSVFDGLKKIIEK